MAGLMLASTGSENRADEVPLRRTTLALYSLPGLVTAVPTIPVFMLLPVLYAEYLGVGLALTGLALFASRALDVITDPLVGRIADHENGRWLKPLIGAGAFITAPALIMLLSPPSDAGMLWLLFSASIVYLGWTMIQIPYLTWGALLSTGYHARTRVTAARESAVLAGILISGLTPAVLGYLGYGEQAGLAAIAWLTVLLGTPGIVLALKYVPSCPSRVRASTRWRGIQENRLFVRLLGAWFVNGVANGIPAVLFTFYCQYVLEIADQTRNWLLAIYLVSAVVSIPFWVSLSRRIPRHRAWAFGMLVSCAAFSVASLLGPGQVAVFGFICIVTGLALGADLVLPPAIQADVADWDRFRFRRNRTASLFAIWNMSAKLALAIAAGMALPVLGYLGLDAKSPTAIALVTLPVIYALVPCVFKFVAVAAVYDLPITPIRQRAVASRLRRRDAARLDT